MGFYASEIQNKRQIQTENKLHQDKNLKINSKKVMENRFNFQTLFKVLKFINWIWRYINWPKTPIATLLSKKKHQESGALFFIVLNNYANYQSLQGNPSPALCFPLKTKWNERSRVMLKGEAGSGNVHFDHCTMIHVEVENEVTDFLQFWLVNSSVSKMAKNAKLRAVVFISGC